MAQQVKTLEVKPDNVRSIPTTCMVEGEELSFDIYKYVPWQHSHTHTQRRKLFTIVEKISKSGRMVVAFRFQVWTLLIWRRVCFTCCTPYPYPGGGSLGLRRLSKVGG